MIGSASFSPTDLTISLQGNPPMAPTRRDITALAKARHPYAVTIQLKRYSDFRTLGVTEIDANHPDWLLTIAGGGDSTEYKADTLDELQTMLSAEQGRETTPA